MAHAVQYVGEGFHPDRWQDLLSQLRSAAGRAIARVRPGRVRAVLVVLLMAGVAASSGVFAAAAHASQSDLAKVLAGTPGVAAVTPSAVAASGDVVVRGVVDVPSQPSRGVHLGSGGNAVTVGLPGAAGLDAADVANNGMVTYQAGDGGGAAVVPTSDGAQLLQVIGSRSAPEAYRYPVQLPAGGRIAVVSTPPGQPTGAAGQAALIVNGANQVIGLIAAPWARDARGKAVETSFTTDGSTLTQHVLHADADVAYPVVADPYFHWYGLGVVITFSYDDMQLIAVGGIEAAMGLLGVSIPTAVGVIPASAVAGALTSAAAAAAWGVATHNCIWLWVPYPGVWDTVDHGYYSC